MCLRVSWPNMRVQLIYSGRASPPHVVVGGHTVDAVDSSCYLGSTTDSSGRCLPNILRRLGLASSSMTLVSSGAAGKTFIGNKASHLRHLCRPSSAVWIRYLDSDDSLSQSSTGISHAMPATHPQCKVAGQNTQCGHH